MQLLNIRDKVTGDTVQGVLKLPGLTLQTLEHLPVPTGWYELRPHTIKEEGPLKGLQCYVLHNPKLNVYDEPPPGAVRDSDGHWWLNGIRIRVAILIHPGNWPQDSLGCILVGKTRDAFGPTPSIGESREAFTELMNILGTGGSHSLEIT